MSEQLSSAADLLSEQAKKYDIALYYTHGNDEKAKQMVAGTYNDIYAIKAKFSSSSMYGAFLLFYNYIYNKVVNSYVIVTPSFAIDDIKTNIDWRIFESEIEKYLNMGQHDDVIRSQFREALTSYFSINIGGSEQQANELKKFIENDDPISVNRVVHKAIQSKVGFQNVNASVDYQQISSVDMELYSKSSYKISEHEINKMKEDEEKKKEPHIEAIDEKEDEEEELKGKEIKLIMNGALILSPIKGKDIGLLAPGDRIKISILDKTQKAMTVLKAFNSYDEDGNHKPVTGRIVAIKPRRGGGFKITAVVAKGIYVKIEEEEDNIKVAAEQVVSTSRGAEDRAEGQGVSIPVIIGLVIIFMLLIGLIIFFIL